MTNNDECQHEWRMKVELTVDAPLARKITKVDLRKKEYQIIAAHWSNMVIYCSKCYFHPKENENATTNN